MRLLEHSAHGNAANGARQLKRRSRNRALADGYGDGFTGVPFAVEHALHPFFARNQTGFFRWQIDAGAMSEAQMRCIVGNSVDAEALPDVVEENIARLHDRFVQIHEAVRTLPENPALELATIESGVGRTKSGEAGRGNFVFEHGGGHDDLEYRAGRELCLDCAIQERLCRIVVQLLPFLVGDANGEIIRVGSGMADHGQYLAATRIECDNRTIARTERLLRDLL